MKAPGSVVPARGVAFQLAGFEVVGDCLQVQGRWFGVRGRRFMRPALTAVVDGKQVRMLADLVDKPWPAEDGELWKAAFPYAVERAQLRETELTVAPDVTVTLPAPRRPAAAPRKRSSSRRSDPPRRAGGRRGSGEPSNDDQASDRLDRSRPGSRPSKSGRGDRDADGLMRELSELRQAHGQLRYRLDRLEAEKAQTARRLDELTHVLREATRERDEATAARDRIAAELDMVQREASEVVAERDVARLQRDQATGDRDAADRARDLALRASEAASEACDRALSEREAALAVQRQAVSGRDSAIAARDRAEDQRNAALSLRDRALAERDAGLAARDDAASAQAELSRINELLQSELADLRSARGAALVMRRAAQAPATRRHALILPRMIATAVVLAIVVSVILLLRAH
jgi:hypothetical protein